MEFSCLQSSLHFHVSSYFAEIFRSDETFPMFEFEIVEPKKHVSVSSMVDSDWLLRENQKSNSYEIIDHHFN